MPRVVGSGGGLSSPVGIVDGGTGATTAAAARAALLGLTAPPAASSWTAEGSASVADVTGGIEVTAAHTAADVIYGATRAVSGDFSITARLVIGGPCPSYSTFGVILGDGTKRSLVGIRVEPSTFAGQVYWVKWAGVTPGADFSSVKSGSQGNLYGRTAWWRVARVGSTITVSVRDDDGPWAVLSTTNDTTDLGLSSAATRVGIGMNPVGSGVTPAAVIRCTSWSAS